MRNGDAALIPLPTRSSAEEEAPAARVIGLSVPRESKSTIRTVFWAIFLGFVAIAIAIGVSVGVTQSHRAVPTPSRFVAPLCRLE